LVAGGGFESQNGWQVGQAQHALRAERSAAGGGPCQPFVRPERPTGRGGNPPLSAKCTKKPLKFKGFSFGSFPYPYSYPYLESYSIVIGNVSILTFPCAPLTFQQPGSAPAASGLA